VIVLGHLPVIMRSSCVFLGEAPKATLVDCASLSYLTYGYVLAVSTGWTRFMLHHLAVEPPSVGRHNEDVAYNTPGVYHQLSSGFKLKHDRLMEMTMSKSNLWK
jgi:hypothetical protein